MYKYIYIFLLLHCRSVSCPRSPLCPGCLPLSYPHNPMITRICQWLFVRWWRWRLSIISVGKIGVGVSAPNKFLCVCLCVFCHWSMQGTTDVERSNRAHIQQYNCFHFVQANKPNKPREFLPLFGVKWSYEETKKATKSKMKWMTRRESTWTGFGLYRGHHWQLALEIKFRNRNEVNILSGFVIFMDFHWFQYGWWQGGKQW